MTTGAFTDPTSVTSVRAGVERFDHHRGDLPDRHRDHGEVGTRHRVAQASARRVPTAPTASAAPGPLGVAVVADHLVPGLAEREADRAADQAGADEREPPRVTHGAAFRLLRGVGGRVVARSEVLAQGRRALEEHVLQLGA